MNYQKLFTGAENILASHRGWDPGAFAVAKYLARHLETPLFFQKVSRLLIEMNRSVDSKELFSEYTQHTNSKVKSQLMQKYYYPYRNEIENKITQYVESGNPVLHISVHTFAPVLNDVVRTVDLGLLYDTIRVEEKELCEDWKIQLDELLPEMLIMHNCPYHGADDGLTTYLRSKFSDNEYLGVELEINQKYVDTPEMSSIKAALVQSLLN